MHGVAFRGLGRWFSVIYFQEELLFEKLSEGVWGGVRGAFAGRSESSALRKHITLRYGRGGVAASSRAGVFFIFP